MKEIRYVCNAITYAFGHAPSGRCRAAGCRGRTKHVWREGERFGESVLMVEDGMTVWLKVLIMRTEDGGGRREEDGEGRRD
jgi:hypothetical protein